MRSLRYNQSILQGKQMNFAMIKRAAFASFIALTSLANAEDAKVAEDMKKDIDTVSYSHGHYIGSQMKAQSEFINTDEFIKGLKAALAGEKSPIPEAEFKAALQKIQAKMQEAQKAKMAEDKKKNIEHITKFLEEKLEKTASGLEYKVIKEGAGEKPKATDKVTVHYTGYLTDGSKFDSSVDRGQPATFGLNQVIKGWTEGVQLMTIGSKYRFKIPPELGYGAAGAGGSIPPNAVLVFDIELISIAK